MKHLYLFLFLLGWPIAGFPREGSRLQMADSIVVSMKTAGPLGAFSPIANGGGFALYHAPDTAIYWFDFKKHQTAIIPHHSDSGKLKAPMEMGAYKRDSIFLLYEDRLSIINRQGKTIFQASVNPPADSGMRDDIIGSYGNTFHLIYNPAVQKLGVQYYCVNCPSGAASFYNGAIAGYYDLVNQKIKPMSVGYPDIYQSHYFGDANQNFSALSPAGFLVGFMATPDLQIQTNDGRVITQKMPRALSQKKAVDTLSREVSRDIRKKLAHLNQSPLYLKIIYDPFRKVYYRYLLNPVLTETGRVQHKDLIVMVLDEDFRLVDEKNVGPGYLWHYSFVGPKGLYILRNENVAVQSGKSKGGQNLLFDRYSVLKE